MSADQYLNRTVHEMEVYEANYEVADLYEAWALFAFSRVCTRFVKTKLRGPESLRLGTMLENNTLLGIKFFVGFYMFKALFYVFRNYWTRGLCASSSWACVGVGDPYLEGAAFLVSTIAIANIVSFEGAFHEELHEFEPKLKFIGVKLLVSACFMQKAAFAVIFGSLAGYSEVQVNLIYSSMISIELFPIALLKWRAWKPSQLWYRSALPSPGGARSMSWGAESTNQSNELGRLERLTT